MLNFIYYIVGRLLSCAIGLLIVYLLSGNLPMASVLGIVVVSLISSFPNQTYLKSEKKNR